MNTIGRNYEVSLSSAMNNTYEFYVAPASSTMSLSELQINADRLQGMVSEWEIKASDPGNNSEETNNATAIVNILQGRLDEYNRLIAAATGSQLQTTTEDDLYSGDPGTVSEKKDYTMLLLIGAGIGALLLFKKKGKKKVTGNDQSKVLLPLLLGGAVVYYFANKKLATETQQPLITTEQPATVAPGEDIPLGAGGMPISDDLKIYEETINY